MIGIGWDVGGWMGTNHGFAVCQWDKQNNSIEWVGSPNETSIPEGRLLSLHEMVKAE